MCFETACSETSYGAASSLTVASPAASRATMSRRVGSASAEKTRDSRSSCSTMWLSTASAQIVVNHLVE